jgi:hypothetical protein
LRIAAGLAAILVTGFAAWLGLAGCAPLPPTAGARGDGDRAVTLFVVRNSWHIEVGFATADLGPPLAPVSAQFPGARYLLFGFGDRHYFLAKNRNSPVLLGALWPGPALVLVTALAGRPAEAYRPEEVAELRVSAEQARAIQSFIRGSLSDVSPNAKGPYEGSLYYAAGQRYSAFHTCNTWAAEALRAGDLPIRVGGVIFAGQLWSQVHKLAQPRVPAVTSP